MRAKFKVPLNMPLMWEHMELRRVLTTSSLVSEVVFGQTWKPQEEVFSQGYCFNNYL